MNAKELAKEILRRQHTGNLTRDQLSDLVDAHDVDIDDIFEACREEMIERGHPPAQVELWAQNARLRAAKETYAVAERRAKELEDAGRPDLAAKQREEFAQTKAAAKLKEFYEGLREQKREEARENALLTFEEWQKEFSNNNKEVSQ